MKLFFHPVSTASKPVVLFCAEAKIEYEPHIVDLMKGAHLEEDYLKLNPSGMVPAIDDDGFVLTESSAILKYLAEKHSSPAYPKDLKARARINERMDWINTQLYREFAYHLVYPQIFPNHTRTDDVVQKATLEWGQKECKRWFKVLNDRMIGSSKYLCGEQISIADYFGAAILSAGDIARIDVSHYANVDRWMKTMRALPSWNKVMEATQGFAQMMASKPFVNLHA
jgi:glutathione S-transferase